MAEYINISQVFPPAGLLLCITSLYVSKCAYMSYIWWMFCSKTTCRKANSCGNKTCTHIEVKHDVRGANEWGRLYN